MDCDQLTDDSILGSLSLALLLQEFAKVVKDQKEDMALDKYLIDTLALMESPEPLTRIEGEKRFKDCLKKAPLPDEFVERCFRFIVEGSYVSGAIVPDFGRLGPVAASYAPALFEAVKKGDEFSAISNHSACALASLGADARSVFEDVLQYLDQYTNDDVTWCLLVSVVLNCASCDEERVRRILARLFLRIRGTTDFQKEFKYDLVDIGPDVVPALLEALPEDPQFFIEIITRMGGATAAYPAMLELAKKDQTRDGALGALLSIGILSDEVKQLIHEQMTERTWSSYDAFYGLMNLGLRAIFALPDLQTWLTDHNKHKSLTEVALQVVGQIGPRAYRAIPLIAEQLKSSDGTKRKYAAIALSRMGPDAADYVQEEVAFHGTFDPIEVERKITELVAANEIMELTVKVKYWGPVAVKALPALRMNIRGNYSEGCVQALRSLGPLAAPAAPDLAEHLQYPYFEAIDALVQIGKAAVPSVLPYTQKPEEKVRAVAFWTLGRLGAECEETVVAVRKGLNAAEPIVRWYAAWCARCSPRLAGALAMELKSVAENDCDEEVRLLARRILG